MFKSLKRSAKGAAVPHEKGTAGMATVTMATPAHVIIPMSMHIGAPAEPVVKKGDQVCVGTLIGKAGGFVSANIYSSVSGTVEALHRSAWSTVLPARRLRLQPMASRRLTRLCAAGCDR